MDSLPSLLEKNPPFIEIIRYYILYYPFIAHLAYSPSLLFAISFSVSYFFSTREILGSLASGISIKASFRYALFFTFFTTLGFFLGMEFLGRDLFFQANTLGSLIRGRSKTYRIQDRTIFSIQSKGKIFYVEYFSPLEKRAENMEILFLSKNSFLPSKLLFAKKVYIQKGKWEFYDGHWIYFSSQKKEVEKYIPFSHWVLPFEEDIDIFLKDIKELPEVGIIELLSLIKKKKALGEPYIKAETEVYSRIGNALSSIWVFLLGIAIGSRFKRGSLAASLGITLLITLGYYILFFLFRSMAHTIGPFLGGMLSSLLLGGISLYLFFTSKL